MFPKKARSRPSGLEQQRQQQQEQPRVDGMAERSQFSPGVASRVVVGAQRSTATPGILSPTIIRTPSATYSMAQTMNAGHEQELGVDASHFRSDSMSVNNDWRDASFYQESADPSYYAVQPPPLPPVGQPAQTMMNTSHGVPWGTNSMPPPSYPSFAAAAAPLPPPVYTPLPVQSLPMSPSRPYSQELYASNGPHGMNGSAPMPVSSSSSAPRVHGGEVNPCAPAAAAATTSSGGSLSVTVGLPPSYSSTTATSRNNTVSGVYMEDGTPLHSPRRSVAPPLNENQLSVHAASVASTRQSNVDSATQSQCGGSTMASRPPQGSSLNCGGNSSTIVCSEARYQHLHAEFMKLDGIRSRLSDEVEKHRRERQPLLQELAYYRKRDAAASVEREQLLCAYRHDVVELLCVVDKLLEREIARGGNTMEATMVDGSATSVTSDRQESAMVESMKAKCTALANIISRVENDLDSEDDGITTTAKTTPMAGTICSPLCSTTARRVEDSPAAPMTRALDGLPFSTTTTANATSSAPAVAPRVQWLADVMHLNYGGHGFSISVTCLQDVTAAPSSSAQSDARSTMYAPVNNSNGSVHNDVPAPTVESRTSCLAVESSVSSPGEVPALTAQELHQNICLEKAELRRTVGLVNEDLQACLSTLDYGFPLTSTRMAGGSGLRLSIHLGNTHANSSVKFLRNAAGTDGGSAATNGDTITADETQTSRNAPRSSFMSADGSGRRSSF